MPDQDYHLLNPFDSVHRSSLLSRRRHIPGPLGMLPECKSIVRCAHKRKRNSFSQDISVSQDNGIWNQVISLFGLDSWKIICEYTIEKIIKNAEMGLPRGKIPVFCAIIDKVDTALPIAKAVLRDETGKIGCTIDDSVIRKYRKFLCSGAILFLKRTSIFSLNQKTFYLNITISNVSRIFLDKFSLGSRLSSSNVADVVVICGANFPQVDPPVSTIELKALVAECLTPPSTLPASNVVSDKNSLLNRHTPTPADSATLVPDSSTYLQRSRGIRSLLSKPSVSVVSSSTPQSNSSSEKDPATSSLATIPMVTKSDMPLNSTTPKYSDWMDDDMDSLLASMVE